MLTNESKHRRRRVLFSAACALAAINVVGLAIAWFMLLRGPTLDLGLDLGVMTGTTRRPLVVVSGRVEQMPNGDYLAPNTLVDTSACSSTNVIAWNGSSFACAAAGGGGGGITNSAGNNVVMKSNGTNAVASGITDNGTNVATSEDVTVGSVSHDAGLTINGGFINNVTVTNAMQGEVFRQFLTGSGRTSAADVFGLVVRNAVTFNTTAGINQSGAIYGEVTSSVDSGGNGLNLYAIRGNAVCGGAGVTTDCYAFFSDHGKIRVDDGAKFGPSSVTGTFDQFTGNVHLNQTSGSTTIDGTLTISNASSTSILSTGGGEVSGNWQVDTNLRVNGTSNLDGGGGSFVYMHKVDTSSVPFEITNSLAVAPERLSGSGATSPIIGNTIVTGTGTALTLANGTKDGETKAFSIRSGTGTITPANLNGGTVYTWSSAPASLILMWDNTATKWVEVAMRNMVLT